MPDEPQQTAPAPASSPPSTPPVPQAALPAPEAPPLPAQPTMNLLEVETKTLTASAGQPPHSPAEGHADK